MMAVSPSIETEMPKKSKFSPSFAVSFACCSHESPCFWNIYADPDHCPLSSSSYAPMMAVSPSIDTEIPKSSYSAPSLGVSFSV